MTLSDFRSEYPEYADLPDSEVMALIDPPESEDDEEEPFEAPGIETGLSGIADQLKKIVTHISKKEKPEKEDNSALLAQLLAIQTAIQMIQFPEHKAAVVNIPATKDIEWMDIKRDEFNNIIRLIPKYK